MPGASSNGRGRNPREDREVRLGAAATKEHSCPEEPMLMEAVVGRETNTRVTARSTPATSMCNMNRRVRNRTHGGVGGRGA
ncbi:MAG: hypothetical protein ACYC0L_00410 [Thermoleophilia bacterium]